VPVPICPIWSNTTFGFGVNVCVVDPIKLTELFPGNTVENPDKLRSLFIMIAALFKLTEPAPISVTIVSKTDVDPKSKLAPEEMEIVSIFIPHELFIVTAPELAFMMKLEDLRLVLPGSIDKAPDPLWIIFGRTQTDDGGGNNEWAEEPINSRAPVPGLTLLPGIIDKSATLAICSVYDKNLSVPVYKELNRIDAIEGAASKLQGERDVLLKITVSAVPGAPGGAQFPALFHRPFPVPLFQIFVLGLTKVHPVFVGISWLFVAFAEAAFAVEKCINA
jgi:hypothetical protein